ncbi:hypothetical protein SAMN05216251_14012 [Actinacidiphila alni]|uniref:Uncharacterized protein n=1 Tax=Actinacidiphila alni TaxID=380248 RepID=A0A1I2MUP9_9ACTN|nr:hypothetical protein [Actinacidiphila alni]SFF93207.1 hypothetical protein SAMN05216251_14012 [Actinacidiphila alni]
MTSHDRTASLRNRGQSADAAVPFERQAHPTSRPADLVITGEMIPEPVAVDADGDLTGTELHELDVCERALANLETAHWLAGKALQVIRDARLYRQTHTRFEQYVKERWDMSVRAAYQLIEEWRLASELQDILGRPATPSHVRALLPVVRQAGIRSAVYLYVELAPRARAEGVRVTADLVALVVNAIHQQAGELAAEQQFMDATREIFSAPAFPSAVPPAPPRRALPQGQTRAEPDTASTPISSAATHGPQAIVQNFTESHGKVTMPPAPADPLSPSQRVPATDDYSDPGPEDMIAILDDLLRRATELAQDITAAAVVDPMATGHAQELRTRIHRCLTAAVHPYRPRS